MHVYKARPAGFKDIQRRLLLRGIPLSILALAVGIGTSQLNADSSSANEVNVMMLVIPVMLGAMGFGIYRSIQQQQQLYDSYTLSISANGITREQYNTPPITIPVGEVTLICKNKDGSFTLKGTHAQDVIGIPRQIEPYETLEEQLKAIQPLNVQDKVSVLLKLNLLLVLLPLALFAVVFVATNKLVIGTGGVILSGYLLWSIVYIHRSKQVDYTTKKRMYWLVVVVLAVIVTTITKLLA